MLRMQLWEGKASSNGVVGWTLQKNIELDKLLALRSPVDQSRAIMMHGYDEDGHAIFISIDHEVFMIELKSLQCTNLFRTSNILAAYGPYRSFCTRGNSSLYFLGVTNFPQHLVPAICWE